MVRDVLELLPVPDADAAARLLLVQECFHQQRGRQDFVARAVQQIGARHMGGAHRFALATTQAVLDRFGYLPDVRLLHDQRLVPHQAEARRVSVGEIGVHQIGFQAPIGLRQQARVTQQLALVETSLRVDPLFVVGKRLQFRVSEELQLGNTNAMFTGNHATQRTRQHHDAFDCCMRGLQHVVVVAVDGNIGVHVAVAGMHMQRDPDPTLEDTLVDAGAFTQDRAKCDPKEDAAQRFKQLDLPARAQAVVLQVGKQRLNLVQPALPLRAHATHQFQRLPHAVSQHLRRADRHRVVLAPERQVSTPKQ